MMSQHTPALPGTFVKLLIDTVARWDISEEELMEGSSIPASTLQKTFWYVDFLEFNRLLERAVNLTGEPGLGIHLGLQMSVTCLGMIGFAAMVAKDVREAIVVSGQFLQMRCPAIRMRLDNDNSMAYLTVEQPMPEYQLHEVGITSLLIGIGQMGQALTGQKMTGIGEIRLPEPAYYDRLSPLINSNICFGQPHDRLIFPLSHLDKPLIMADPQAARLAREQCKKALGAASGSHQKLTMQVRDLVFDEVLGFYDMDEMASKLHVSRRTLQRQLGEENTAFSDIVERLREEKASTLLRQDERSIAEIADYLGYTDTANFNRAFKRWKGMTASQYKLSVA